VTCINAFTVDARAVDKTGDGKVVTTIKNAAGKKINAHTENKNDGTYRVTYILPEEGIQKCLTQHFNCDLKLNMLFIYSN